MQGGIVCCRIALGQLFCGSWTPLGPNFEPLGRLLERLGHLLERLGRLWERLGRLLDVFGAQLGASWAPLGASWTPLGPPNWPPSATWAPLGPPSWRSGVLQTYENLDFPVGKPQFLQGGVVYCRIALGQLFCGSWTPLGRLCSPTSSLLDASWSVLGTS